MGNLSLERFLTQTSLDYRCRVSVRRAIAEAQREGLPFTELYFLNEGRLVFQLPGNHDRFLDIDHLRKRGLES